MGNMPKMSTFMSKTQTYRSFILPHQGKTSVFDEYDGGIELERPNHVCTDVIRETFCDAKECRKDRCDISRKIWSWKYVGERVVSLLVSRRNLTTVSRRNSTRSLVISTNQLVSKYFEYCS
ncbi:hypothetical protein JTB14_014585 [Gonioctena quinquepunctata]|nr:hypothetical protein JTB14_014585 [Gonioctena quinquepunctata]